MPQAFLIVPEHLPDEINVDLSEAEGAEFGLGLGNHSFEVMALRPPATTLKDFLLLAVVREGIARGLIVGKDLT